MARSSKRKRSATISKIVITVETQAKGQPFSSRFTIDWKAKVTHLLHRLKPQSFLRALKRLQLHLLQYPRNHAHTLHQSLTILIRYLGQDLLHIIIA